MAMRLVPELATLLLPFRGAALNGAPPLRVGVVRERGQSPPWVNALVSFLSQVPGIDVQPFVTASQGLPEPKRPSWLAERLYSASRARFDPFGDLVPGGTESDPTASIDAIREAGCDVIVWLAGAQDPDTRLRGLAKHGVFTVRLGDQDTVIPFWDEAASGKPTCTTFIFWHDTSFTERREARRAETSSSRGLFITESAEQAIAAAIRMLAGLCLEIQGSGGQFEERVRGRAAQRLHGAARPNGPSNFESARFASRKLIRSAYLRWKARGKTPKWFVAMRPNQGDSITEPAGLKLAGFREVPLPRGVQAMADPFLWEAGGIQYLLFEEVAEGQSRGRLGCVEVSPNGSCSEMKIILDRPYHLSYPCVVPSGGDLFLLPEAADANRVDVYRFSRFPWDLELVSSPIEGVALVDTTPVFVDGRWYFFTTTAEPFMETLLFSATRLEGPWSLHPCNPVSASVRNSRSAGHLFWKDGRLFRPTQDCSVRYGYAIAVNEVVKLTPDEFEERLVNHLPPRWMPGLLGTHTWNESSVYQAIDGIRYAR